MMFLVIGYSNENTLRHFVRFARKNNADFRVLDLLALSKSKQIHIEETANDLVISTESSTFLFSDFSAFYCRFYYNSVLSPLRAMTAYMQECDQIVVNRPSAGVDNINKFAHLQTLVNMGFNGKLTCIFGDDLYASRTITPDETWISKSCSSIKTKVAVVDSDLYQRMPYLDFCPSLFQRRVIGPDVRVHVVGTEIFGEKIISQRVDYRYSDSRFGPNQFEPCAVPEKAAFLCREYCRKQGLAFAGIDFKISESDGKWYVLEANPMPGYESYDSRLNHSISRALLNYLTEIKNHETSRQHS
jgi:glutathione synthase/RimK-type ligase-like ATP-grasp enzyme